MKEYEKIYIAIREYFLGLGYNETMFETEISTFNQFSNAQYIDFAIKKSNNIHIIVEAKALKSFIGLNDDDLKYEPTVRQVQMLALDINAPYYVVTNGSEFLWFETNEDGRPKKIEPIFNDNQNTNYISEDNIGEALNICRELLKADPMCSDFMYELVLMLLVRLAVKDRISPEEISYNFNAILRQEYSFNIPLVIRVDRKTIYQCWRVIDDLRPENSNKTSLINTLKILAQKNKNNYSFRINDKLSDFIMNLAKPSITQSILDPAANFGEIITAIYSSSNQTNIFSYCQSIEQFAFLTLINKILYDDAHSVNLKSYDEFVQESYSNSFDEKYDMIISAFPFGKMSKTSSNHRYGFPVELNNIEDCMLLASIEKLNQNGRLIAIVPESMLFSGGKREWLRRYIVGNYCLRAVISLPIGALASSNAKSSIIVIDKAMSHTGSVFFGVVNSNDFNDNRLFLDEQNKPFALLKAYEDYLKYNYVPCEEFYGSYMMSPDVENLRAETFLSFSEPQIESNFPTYKIKDVCISVKKGSAIKNDENGNIRFLGPATVRVNKIDAEKISYTTNENLKSNTFFVKSGTVLINNISSHIGAAAVYNGEQPIAINQHIIALSPIVEKVLPQYLAIALNSKEVKSSIVRMATGAVIPSITLNNLKDIKIPVPDIGAQQKIIAAVERLQNEILELDLKRDALEKRLTDVINTLDIEEV